MRRNTLVLSVAMLLAVSSLAGCGGGDTHENELRSPLAASAAEGQDYEDVVKQLEAAGFTNVETKVLDDLVTGWLTSDGEVEQVSINGVADFDGNDWFPTDASVVVTYHTFPEEGSDKGPSDSSEESGTAEAVPTEEPAASDAADEVLTAESNPDLAALLVEGDNCSATMADFATKYAGRTIEFDGSIVSMGNHGDYDTRYDFLLAPEDYSENAGGRGPAFQFSDVNVFDLDLTGPNVPDLVGVGQNFHFVAEVSEYEANSCLFLLDPIETQFRG
ncbi:DUF4839 domain-containing protein [Puerhibacterium sp. TATVAM-FAB25]|uniref:DUF4839 domain-containing protein n=1 Tax=Puerhibacterium sp. TATVAM-FAB25 TaxID=3093699 RepID=UPI003979458E